MACSQQINFFSNFLNHKMKAIISSIFYPSQFMFTYLCQENGLPGILRAEEKLRQALEPAHIQLLSQISKLPGGVKDIVDMRKDLLVREDF